jgi:hypothetical protein
VPGLAGLAMNKIVASQYWVYENYPNNKAVGHVQSCSFFKKWGGNAAKTGKWLGPFDSKSEAIAAG